MSGNILTGGDELRVVGLGVWKNMRKYSASHRKDKVEKEVTLDLTSKANLCPVGREEGGAERAGSLQCPDVPLGASHLGVARLTHPFLIKAVSDLSPDNLAHQLKLD